MKEANDCHTHQLETCMEYSISTNYYYNEIALHVRMCMCVCVSSQPSM